MIKMRCQRCGAEGEIEVQGLNSDKTLIFRHVGHNPYSGHLHYQCYACEIIILVDPLAMLNSLPFGHTQKTSRADLKHQKH